MNRFPRSSSPSNLSVFTSCLLSFLMLMSPVAAMAGSVKMAEAADAQRKLTADQKTEAFLFNAPVANPTPEMSATMIDTFTDGDADGKVELGDTITYTADIKNDDTNVAVDATGVKFNATLDPNTTIVPGSVKVSPLAFDDDYVATKNTPLNSGTSLLANDTGKPGTPTLVVTAVSVGGVVCSDTTAPFENCATALGGEVDVNADGTFTYTPQTGDTGADSFSYTISNGVTPPNPGVDDKATVTINIDARPEVTDTTPDPDATGVAKSSDITITFSEEVKATTSSFKIECPTGGAEQAFSLSASPSTSFTLNPTANLPSGECRVTVFATEIEDTDLNDPPDGLTADYTFKFTTVNAAPQVVSGNTLNYTEGGAATAINAALTVTEADGDDLSGASASIATNYQAGQDFLGWTDNNLSDNITLDGTSTAQTIVLTGTDTAVHYQAALRAVTYHNTNSDNPNTSARTVTFSATDTPGGATGSATSTINVAAVNDAPVNTVPGVAQIVADTATLTFNSANNNAISVSDVDAGAANVQVKVSVPATKGTFTAAVGSGATLAGNNTNSLTITGTLTQVNNALNGLVYTPPAATTESITMTVETSDLGNTGSGGTKTDTDTVTINVDQAPFVSSTDPADHAPKVGTDDNITITFSENVTVTDPWFTISCASSGTHTAVVTGGPKIFTLNPGTDFTIGEVCTVTIDRLKVEDADANDPPQNMAADYVFDFTIDNPPAVTTTVPADNDINIAKTDDIVINFNEEVDVTTNSFKIECPAPGNTQAFAVTGSGTNQITLNPSADLPPGVLCTVTVFANQVEDSDAGDPPSNLTADKTFTFGVKPEAVDDARNATGNVQIQTAGRSNFTVLSNDIGPGIAVTAFDTTSAHGGTVAVAANGTFSYNPPAGYNGADTFNYTISNAAGSDVGTVTITISDMLWFVKNNAATSCTTVSAATGCGRLTNPLTTLTALDTANGNADDIPNNVYNPQAGDHIFIYEGSGNYTGPLTLENTQRVIGEGAVGAFVGGGSLTGVTLAADSDSVPSTTGSASDRPTITSAGFGFNLAQSNRLHGLAFSNTTNTAVNGSAGGAFVFSEISVNNPSSNGGGISVTAASLVDANSIEVTGNNTIVTRSGIGLRITNHNITTNNVTFQSISVGNNTLDADPANGINIDNTGPSIGFGTVGGLKVPGSGTTDGSGGTIQRTTSSGVRLVNTRNVDIKNMNLTANGQTQTVTGSNTNCGGNLRTGNNLQCVANLYMQGVNTVSLSNLNVTGSGQMGINGNNVTTFTLSDSTVTGNGTEDFENGITFQNLFGTNSITDTIIKNNRSKQIHISNTTSNTSLTLGITGTRTANAYPTKDTSTTTIGNDSPSFTANTQQGILFETTDTVTASTGTSINMTLNVTGVVFPNNYPQNALDIQHIAASGVLNGTTTNSSFDNNAGGAILSMQNGSGTSTYNVTNSEFNRSNLQSILYSAANPYNGALTGTISGNTIGTAGQSGSACEPVTGNCNGIDLIFIGGSGSISTRVQGNTLQEWRGLGIQVRANGTSSPDMNVNIVNNTLQNPAGLIAHGIETNMGTTAGANIDGCLGITGNNISGTYEDPGAGTQFGILTNVRFSSHHKLPNYLGSSTAVGGPGNAVTDFIIANNTTGGKVFTQRTAPGDYPGGSACSTPLILAAGGIESALTSPPLWSSFGLSTSDESSPSAPVSICGRADAALASTLPASSSVTSSLNQQQLDSTVAAAIERWASAGLTPQQLATLRGIKFSVADLAGSYLGEAHGRSILIDSDAGGTGWYVDATPLDDSEFGHAASATRRYTDPSGAPAGRVDLLTAIMHEMGHRLDIADSYAFADGDSLMYGYLTKGERRLPTTGQTAQAVSGVHQSTHFLSLSTDDSERRAAQTKAKAQPAAQPLAPVADLPVTIGTIPAGKKVRVTFEVTVKNAASYTGANAFVSAQGTVTYDDPNNTPTGTLSVQTDDTGTGANNGETDPTKTDVDSQPDLVLTKDDNVVTSIFPGQDISYTLNYNNTNGKRKATGVKITETVPANTVFKSAGSTATWSCSNGSGAGTTCELTINDLDVGATGSATFIVTVLPAIPAGVTDISNTASITYDTATLGADGTPADNSDTELTAVTAAPNLKIVKTANSLGVKAGEFTTYKLAYSNIGNQGATGVVISDTIPTGTTFNSAESTTGWNCPNNNAGTVCTFSVGALASGGSGEVTFAVTTTAGNTGQVDNTASIADDGTNGLDPDTADNSDSASTPYDDPPTLGNYPASSVLVTDGVIVKPTGGVKPDDDNGGFSTSVSVSAGFTGTATVDQTSGDVTISNAGPYSASPYTVTVKVKDSINQETSKTFDLTVNKSATTTSVTSSKNPSFNNQQVTFEATVVSNTTITGPPTGTVDFFDGATLICDNRPLSGNPAKATCSISTLNISPPDHDITATYNGDAAFDTSTSAVFNQTVNPSLNFTVNTLGDAVDDNPGDDRCDTDGNNGNGDQCTLRAAIQEANSSPSDDVISFSLAPNSTITLGTALPDLGDNVNSGDLEINGPGAATLRVRRDTSTVQFRIFKVNSGKTVNISGMIIFDGDSDQEGGAIFNQGKLTLTGVVVTGNRTDVTGGGIHNETGGELTITSSTVTDNDANSFGGGISNEGKLTVIESTIHDNRAFGGGGIATTGASTTLDILNSTISDNKVTGDGGGLRIATTTTTTTNVTITDNRADNDGNGSGTGGGIFRSGASGTVTLRNTIVAGNFNDPSPSTVADDISGTVAGSFNLIGAGGAGTLVNGVNGNQVGVADARLKGLADNGGPTKTHALRSNSPALDAGSNALAVDANNNALANDQRGAGFNRIVDSASDPDTTATVDVGAFEAQVSVAKIANQGTAEDTPLAAFDFEVVDGGTSSFTVTAESSDQDIVQDANLILGGSGSTRNLAITPTANKFGVVTITVTVSGQVGSDTVSMTDSFDFTVTPVADTPDVADVVIDEDTLSGPIVVTRNAADGAEVTHFRVTAITGGRLYMPDGATELVNGDFVAFADAAPGLRFRPRFNDNLTGHFTVRGATGNINAALGPGTDTSTITVNSVNDPPTLAFIEGVSVLEDSSANTVGLRNVTAGGGESQGLTVTATSANHSILPDPTVIYTSPDSTGSLSITPVHDAFGSVDVTVTVQDDGPGTPSFSRTFTVKVVGVNDAPSFTKGPDQTVAEDPGAQTVPNWATNITPGTNEVPNPLRFIVTGNTNTALFAVQPAVSSNGTLNYTPAPDAVGTAQITIVLKDFRNEDNGGENTSQPATFNITVNPVNDAPTLGATPGRVYNEDSGLQTVSLSGITAGPPDEAGQSLSVTATSSDTSVVPNPTVNYTSPNATGSLSFTPVANANGAATITVTVKDNGGGTDTLVRTFLVTVREVNDSPVGVNDSLPLGNEDTPRTIPFSALVGNDFKGPANEAGQQLTITKVTAGTGGTVSISGTDVVFTPEANYNGPASFTYTLRDDGTTAGAEVFKTSTAQVSFNIKPVNDAPFNKVPGPQTVEKNGKRIFSVAYHRFIKVYDVDAGLNTIRVRLQAAKGTITLASLSGLTFLIGDGADDPAMTFEGTLADVNAALDGLTFKPTANYVGAASLTITSNDLGHSPTPAKADMDTIAITVAAPTSKPVDAAKAGASTFELSAPTYTVSEGAQRATVTVKRTGDLSAPAAVRYSTADLSGLAPCGLANGNASARCDYAVGAGKLRFAAGQSSLAVTIPLVNDAYKEGPENFTLTLAVKKGDGGKLGAARSATITVTDDDAGEATASPLSSNEFFVRQLYLDYLGREPDEEGFASWLGTLKDCAGKDCGRESVAAAFFNSREFREKTYFAFSLYRAALGRAARYDELAPDAAGLNSARTDAELLENKADYVADFMGRAEFKARYESLSDADYVDALLLAAALPNHPQRAAWAAGLADGSLTRGDVLWQFAESEEVYAKFADEAEVTMPYLLLLRRSPDAPFSDRGVFLRTQDPRQTFAGFLNSEEYQKRVGP